MDSNLEVALDRINGAYETRRARGNFLVKTLSALGVITSIVLPHLSITKNDYETEPVVAQYKLVSSQRHAITDYANLIDNHNRTKAQSEYIESELERITRVEEELKNNPTIEKYLRAEEKRKESIDHKGELCLGLFMGSFLLYLVGGIYVESSSDSKRMKDWDIFHGRIPSKR